MNTVLWISRHQPLASQLKELRRKYGEDCRVVVEIRYTFSAEWVAYKYKELQAKELILVAPLSVVKSVIDLGIYPLHAIMQKVDKNDPRAEISPNGMLDGEKPGSRYYRFIKFKRYKKFNIEMEDL